MAERELRYKASVCYIRSTMSEQLALVEPLRTRQYVNGLTHNFYRYPARFHPTFARQVIATFSVPNDVVLDPFVGGGTTVVEALVAGRKAIGSDLNALALFLSRLKTTTLSKTGEDELHEWLSLITSATEGQLRTAPSLRVQHVPRPLERVVSFCLDRAHILRSTSARLFARGATLRTAQWALDGRQHLPPAREFLGRLIADTSIMIDGARELANSVSRRSDLASRRHLILASASSLTQENLPRGWKRPKLVVTSPPYMGIHVLYNRWQVEGRRETPLPYTIAGVHDGHFASHYAFGGRHRAPAHYLQEVEQCFAAVRRLLDESALVVQLVAFSDPRSQLPAYLAAMSRAGFREERLPARQRRVWRDVPNRRWYIRTNGHLKLQSREVLLVHRVRG